MGDAMTTPKIELGTWNDAMAFMVWGDPADLTAIVRRELVHEGEWGHGPLWVHKSTQWRKVPADPLCEFAMRWHPYAAGRGSFAARLVALDAAMEADHWSLLDPERETDRG